MADPIFEHPRLVAIYDALDPDSTDLDVYAAIASELGARHVVDLGCGTGTFALQLADCGLVVTGVDLAAGSLAVARAKPGAERVTWIHGEATTVPPMAADLATMTGNVAQAIIDPTEWDSTLRGVHRALRPGGHLAFGTRDPDDRAWCEWNRAASYRITDIEGIGVVESWVELTDVRGALVSFAWTWVFAADGAVLTSGLTLRFRERDEVEASLLAHGYVVDDVRDAPSSSQAAAMLRWGWPVSGRVLRRPRSPRPLARWSPGYRPTPDRGAFGGYGAWKGVGYTLGPLLGGVVIHVGGFPLLFATLAVLAAVLAVWAGVAVPALAALPRIRQTVLDVTRRLTQPGFLRPTLTLAATTAALSVGVGFLPVRGAAAGLGPLATGAVVSVLAAVSALVQPWAGRARDTGGLPERPGMAAGLLLVAVGFTLAATLPGLIPAAVAVGAGVGVVTPLAFVSFAAAAPPQRLGQTMGAAEVGRELGDAGGPLLVGAVAAAASLPLGLGGLPALLAVAAAVAARKGTTQATG